MAPTEITDLPRCRSSPASPCSWRRYGGDRLCAGAFARRAAVDGKPLGDYVYRELLAVARRSTITDAMSEFRAVRELDPSLDIDMGAVLASVRYARGE